MEMLFSLFKLMLQYSPLSRVSGQQLRVALTITTLQISVVEKCESCAEITGGQTVVPHKIILQTELLRPNKP